MATKNAIHPKPSTRTFASVDLSTAANGISDSVSLAGLTLCGIQMSTDWTDAKIGFRGSLDNSGTFFNIYNSAGDFLTFTTSASRIIAFDPLQFAAYERIQVVSETSAGVAVAQAATRTIILGLAEIAKCD